MNLATTASFISTVKADHTIQLPEEIPVDAKVAAFLMPAEEPMLERSVRHARFERVMGAIRAAMADGARVVSPVATNQRDFARRQPANA